VRVTDPFAMVLVVVVVVVVQRCSGREGLGDRLWVYRASLIRLNIQFVQDRVGELCLSGRGSGAGDELEVRIEVAVSW
jgi:hypothetical protein